MDLRSNSSYGVFQSSSSSFSSSLNRMKTSEKLTSKKNILTQIMLPRFMKATEKEYYDLYRRLGEVNRPSTPDERSPSPVSKGLDCTEEQFEYSPENYMSKAFSASNSIDFQSPPSKYFLFLQSLKKEENKAKVVLKFAEYSLNISDILSIADPGPLSRTAIDVSLSLLKKLNFEILQKDEAKSKIIIASTAFAWRIFNQQQFEDLHAPSYVFLYDFILFPIFIGQWALLVVDTKDLAVNFYSIGNADGYLEGILVNCFKFLEQEYFFYGGKKNDLNFIKTLRYECSQCNVCVDDADSAAFVLMVAEKIAAPGLCSLKTEDQVIDKDSILEFKEKLLTMVISNGEYL